MARRLQIAESAAAEGDDAFLARLEARAAAAKDAPALLALPEVDAARLISLTVKLAKGGGAKDLTLGEGLAALRQHDLKLGYNGIGDLALDRLGIDPAHARWLAAMAGKLAARPLVREAVVAGELSLRKADAIVDVAFGGEERRWLDLAKVRSVRELEAATKPGTDPYDQGWRELFAMLDDDPVHREGVEEAFGIASVVLGHLDAPRWKVLQAISMEFLGGFPLPEHLEDGSSGVAREDVGAEACVKSSGVARDGAGPTGSSDLARPTPPAAGPATPPWPRPRPRILLRELEALVKDRIPEDERLGRALVLVKFFRAWKVEVEHVQRVRGFEAFCVEVLGIAPSTARQRMTLERNLRPLPELRAALRDGTLSYEQARAVAKVATPADVKARIEAAAAKPALDTKREVREEQDRQIWRTGEVRFPVPKDVDALFKDAVTAARLRAGAPLTPGQALFMMSAHFTETWVDLALALWKKADEVMKRDQGRCQVPGCSHAAQHVHHIRFRSHGGGSESWNLVALCAAHHLVAIHQGFIRVRGRAPDDLVWEFFERDGLELAVLDPEDREEAPPVAFATQPLAQGAAA
ncbi:MAG: HNH endonuclease signature motif containing protein [Anaeromyxobacter sp.]